MSQPYVKEDPKTGLLIEWIPVSNRCRPVPKPKHRRTRIKRQFDTLIQFGHMTVNEVRVIEGHKQLNERLVFLSKIINDFGLTCEEFGRAFNNTPDPPIPPKPRIIKE